ncbi:MAG: molybdopterin-synthase adenylyltransferase MoeB [Anaerolineales bacterium]|nr:molybdopterin-synthase adenylyltransferase MoeB [Anaerolineales bacterium]
MMKNTSSERIGLAHSEFQRYSRQLLLPEVGLQGQERLKASSILIIGTGGLGSPVSMYLAAAGVGRIGLVDHDVVEFNNLQRQIIHGTSRLGDRKVLSARDRLVDINPEIDVVVYDEPFTSENAEQISKPFDLLIDASDNFPTRYLINDLCVLAGKPDVSVSVLRFDGQVSVFWGEKGPCYRCLFPDPPPPGLIPSCAEGGVLGLLPGTIGTLQATEAIKLLLGIGTPLIGTLLIYDALDMHFETVKLKKNPECKVCSENPSITQLIDYDAFCGVPGRDNDRCSHATNREIEPSELAKRLAAGESIQLIDVREPHELQISALPDANSIPLGSMAIRKAELDEAEEIVLFCRIGTRSTRALQLLTGAGFQKVMNLKGGINAWARQVDPTLPIY